VTSGRSLLLYQFTKMAMKLVWNTAAVNFLQDCVSIFLSGSDPYSEDHQCGFRYNRSTTDKIFCNRQITNNNNNNSVAFVC
jgi:hypothetical protein